MPEMLWVMLYAMLPVIGHWLGAALAISTQPPPWIAGAALHGSAGIAIALVSMDLMPKIQQSVPVWLMMVLFVVGAAISVALSKLILRLKPDTDGASYGAIMIYAAIGVDLVSDGMMTGAGFAVQSHLGLLLAAAQAVSNIPGGFSATVNLQHQQVNKGRQWLIAGLIVVPVLISAVVGFWLLTDASALVQQSILMIIVGLLLMTTIEDIIPEADAPCPPRAVSTCAFAAGFVGLILMSEYLG